MLNAVGLYVPLRMRGDFLTAAQKQLLEIAKALAMRPKVLILDEPTASLDRESTDMPFDRIRAVVKTELRSSISPIAWRSFGRSPIA